MPVGSSLPAIMIMERIIIDGQWWRQLQQDNRGFWSVVTVNIPSIREYGLATQQVVNV
ncbi:hypothetical protein DAPPUDRAFT_311389 [Daphnia pulex]|uniref:Uncharacterized protein n=1 Tax=Daphnia pulex TaxID=6669 RepID=E9FWR9_DAPPU|nr:hypothetical protein DAPPUDRAFT_311389 [Daphnia pulex]|eukprot:EFX88385.1 hypothetical protein DAPPUDRAFT_311389 [Daphnia pulex]